ISNREAAMMEPEAGSETVASHPLGDFEPGEPRAGTPPAARRDELAALKEEFRSVRLSTVIPLAAWWKDRPWNLLWVRWFLFYALFPLALASFYGEGVQFGTVAWALGLYFAGVWLTVLNLTMKPGKIQYAVAAQIWFFTV